MDGLGLNGNLIAILAWDSKGGTETYPLYGSSESIEHGGDPAPSVWDRPYARLTCMFYL